MTEIQRLKLLELKKFREALLPLGYWVYSMSGAGESRITICARKPEDENDWNRLRHIEARENSELGQQSV